MKSISFLFGLLLLSATILVACTSNSLMRSSEKQQIVEHVKTVEESEFDLIYFNKSYKQYHNAINEIVSEEYWASIRSEIIFGYDSATYTRDDLVNMPQEEYDKHKEHMLNLIHGIGMEKLSATVRISDVYEGEQSNQVNIYTIENKELKDQPFSATTKKYTLEKYNEKWLITKVEQDKFNYVNEQTAEEMEEGIKGLNYQTHEGKVIGYPTVIVLSGVGKV
ncbi:hypothetical protein QPK24_06690 [Paenibacillus polygoni]|uniref:Uncharacterized protein n=1 Tax=Paenibacillus polygoni TaxID=3050112 RepID=A0ABY8X4L5_9BACL|nr:hypothetical protein [Paenibacillus polygoni]WIV20375.1 hypothetical protein QPK24_06690 [Paenibacillus polygoni]